MAGADAPAAALTDLAGQTLDVAKTLKRHQVSWQVQISGWQMHRPGRGQILTPPLNIQQYDGDGVVATFQFSRFHLGDGGVVHGGAIPLMVDELFSQWAQTVHGDRTRTACLKVVYRHVTPIDETLTLRGWPEEQKGRKLVVRGQLTSGATLLCDLEAVFVSLRPEQP